MSTAVHTFALCAYGESPYIRECLESLLSQEGIESSVYIATSTPSAYLDGVADEFGVPLFINDGESGIGQDWNFAYERAATQYVTIAHQDDVYLPSYAKRAVAHLQSDPASLIYFSNYGELRDGVSVDEGALLSIKRFLLRKLNKEPAVSVAAKQSALRFGSAICCPAVTFNSANCPHPPFVVGMKSNLDWATWEALSKLAGSFIYDDRILMRHRIHRDSATSALIANKKRDEEDLEMLRRFWPVPIAFLIELAYSKGTKSNEL